MTQNFNQLILPGFDEDFFRLHEHSPGDLFTVVLPWEKQQPVSVRSVLERRHLRFFSSLNWRPQYEARRWAGKHWDWLFSGRVGEEIIGESRPNINVPREVFSEMLRTTGVVRIGNTLAPRHTLVVFSGSRLPSSRSHFCFGWCWPAGDIQGPQRIFLAEPNDGVFDFFTEGNGVGILTGTPNCEALPLVSIDPVQLWNAAAGVEPMPVVANDNSRTDSSAA
ncbi:hypothetical protein UFOVP1244_87 [uncultured Caudovirales phage]|uniref:Uncharacterized protein n=1 Tax=uncultured Caudovirales phage TaxID=2100421 RepID=A0A6J5RGS5_9CAUD|nr:hypothetical protein UFOVP1244_87 [uncultured Caudovirales phage]